MTVSSTYKWQLPEKLVDRSVNKEYKKALGEWRLEYVYDLEPEEPNEHCLCTHWIRQVCVVKNARNNNEAMIGNCCIRRFKKHSPSFEGMRTASDCLRRIKSDFSRAPNTGLIQHAFRRGVLNQWEVAFCTKTQKKRLLTRTPQREREQINRKLILGICTSAQEALRQIRYDTRASANPRLIEKALEQRVISEEDAAFYKKIWALPHEILTPSQQKYKEDLNGKMIAMVSFQNI